MKTTRRLLRLLHLHLRVFPALLVFLRGAAASGLFPASPACVSDQCKVELSPDLTLLYQIHLPREFEFYTGDPEVANQGWPCGECRVSVQLSLAGLSWIGFGPSRDGETIGSRVVVGKPGRGAPRDYYLRGEEAEYIDGPMDPVSEEDDATGGLYERKIEYVGGRTVMGFDMAFGSWGINTRVGPILNNEYTFLWAHGGEGEVIPQEVELMGRRSGPSDWTSHDVANLMGFAPDVIDDARGRFPSATAPEKKSGGSAVSGAAAAVLAASGVLVAVAVAVWPGRRGKDGGKDGGKDAELAEKRRPPVTFNDSDRVAT